MNIYQRKFVSEVRRCHEMGRKLMYLKKEINKEGIPVLDIGENPSAPRPREIIDLEVIHQLIAYNISIYFFIP